MYLRNRSRFPSSCMLCLFGLLALIVGCPPGVTVPDGVTGGSCGVGPFGPTTHTETEITSDTTWTAATSPHIVSTGLTIRNGATLTIETCTEVRIDPNVQIRVGLNSLGEPGTLLAVGTADSPIRFLANGSDRWNNLLIHAPGNARMAYVTIEGAGSNEITFDGASVVVWGDSQPPLALVADFNQVTVQNSAGFGVLVERWGGFTANSTGLTVMGSGSSLAEFPYPVREDAQVMGTLPPGDYTGNALDEILVNPTGGIIEDVTIRDAGVPYRIANLPSATLNVTDDAVLMVDAGVVIKSEPGMQIRFGNAISGGALQAEGQSNNSIVFTSASTAPQPGDWVGLRFESPPPAGVRNSLDWVHIEFAGADCSCGPFNCPTTLASDSALLILGWEPVDSFLTNSTISDCAGHGVLRGWDDATCGTNVLDMSVGNMFVNIGGMDQTTPRFKVPPCQQLCP